MTDAELMTTAPDVPGLEVKAVERSWQVHVAGVYLGDVLETPCGKFVSIAKGKFWPSHSTRNAAVQWILDQHKPKTQGHATCTEMPF